MKQATKILLSLTLLFAFHLGIANTEGTDGKNTEKDAKQQQQTGQQNKTEKLDEEPSSEGVEGENEVVVDSVEDDSVSKYNFIFYFLYKFKYDQEEEI